VEFLKNKKIAITPASPLCISFARQLEKNGFLIECFFDSKKTGDNIFKPSDISKKEIDFLLIYNELFFKEIYKNFLNYFPKEKIFKVQKTKEGYKLLDYKEIKKILTKQKLENIKISFYNKIQIFLTKAIDILKIKRKKILFLSKDNLGSNQKYLYNYIKKDKALITSKEFNTLKSYITISFAKYIIVEQVIYEYFNNFSKNQKTIQLWHGVGLKKLNVVDIEYDYFISTSTWTNESNFKHRFRAKEFLNLGYPRCDIFFRELNKQDLWLCDKEILSLSKKHKTILYMPTYRDDEDKNIPLLDFEKLNDFCKEMKIFFILKLHPFIKKEFQKSYSNIIFYNSQTDIYPILKYTDILVSDYSSVMYDFLLLDREMIAFVYDKEEYEKTRGGFLYDYDKMTPAIQVKTQNELQKAIKDIFNSKIDMKQKREEIKKMFFDFNDGKSCKRIYEKILQ